MIKPGQFMDLRVLRKTDIGYMLTDENEEVFLHFNETVGELKDNDVINVFIYYDKKKRITATMHKASITVFNPGWVNVVEVNKSLGVFVGIGISKDLLIPTDFLPYNFSYWPEVGSKLFCILKAKKENLNAKIVNNEDAKKYSKLEELNVGDKINATITKISDAGVGLYTDSLSFIFVNRRLMREEYKLGQNVEVEIISIVEDRINGTLIKNKEFMIDDDSQIVLNYLTNSIDRKMKYGNGSTPDEIFEAFKMSKKAFKRALGHLYKERKIDFIDGYTVLK